MNNVPRIVPLRVIGRAVVAGIFGSLQWYSSVSMAQTYEIIHAFNGSDGGAPQAGLIQGSDGLFYGTTSSGGGGYGTVFKIDSNGQLTTLHSFGGADGALPTCVLVEASDGNFYGTTQQGGTNNHGTVFKIDSSGNFTSLHRFVGVDGSFPHGGLVEAAGSFLYGTTFQGGVNDYGTVYRIDFAGSLTTIHEWTAEEGNQPTGNLIRAADGFLYGTTANGGPTTTGSVFRIDVNGDFGIVRDLTETEGSYPNDSVIQANDGAFYSTALFGGTNSAGTVFRVDASGNFTKLHDFGGPEGSNPMAGVVQGADDYFYTTTFFTPSYLGGAIIRVGADGSLEVVHDFDDGARPWGSLIQASDGWFYGTTSAGGNGGGSVFRFDTRSASVQIAAVSPHSGPAAGGSTLAVTGAGFQPTASLAVGAIAATNVTVVNPNEVDGTTPALVPGILHSVLVENPDLTSNFLVDAWFADFLDVDSANLYHDFVESIVRAGITSGCGGGNYCPDNSITRGQMAVFLLKSKHGSGFIPPACGGVFPDVPCPSQFADWIEELHAEGITGGCGGGNYCPSSPVRRDQMAAFLLKSEHGSSYVPPACTGIFPDVACPSQFADWIEQLAAEAITGGCGGGNYCPSNPNTRGQMAVFLVKTFGLLLYRP